MSTKITPTQKTIRISPSLLENYRYLRQGYAERIVQKGGHFITDYDETKIGNTAEAIAELIVEPTTPNRFMTCGSLIDRYVEVSARYYSNKKPFEHWQAQFCNHHNFSVLDKIKRNLEKKGAIYQHTVLHEFIIGIYKVQMEGRMDVLLANGNVLDVKTSCNLNKLAYSYHNSLQMDYYMYKKQCKVGVVLLVPYKMEQVSDTKFLVSETYEPKIHHIERTPEECYQNLMQWLDNMIHFLESFNLIDHDRFKPNPTFPLPF